MRVEEEAEVEEVVPVVEEKREEKKRKKEKRRKKSVVEVEKDVMSAVGYAENQDNVFPQLLAQSREVVLLLVESRKIMQRISEIQLAKEQLDVEERREQLREEKKLAGLLTITEIQEVLRSQPEEEELDWVTEMQRLKNELAKEIRRNYVLDRKLGKLDKRIGLLIKNRNALESYLKDKAEKSAKKAKQLEEGGNQLDVSDRRLELYQELFYLLQTEPRYLAALIYVISPEEMDTFLETTILTLYGDAFSPREEFLILRLFALSIRNEMDKIKSLGDFLKANTVVPKMVITYNRRKQGLQFLRKVLGPHLTPLVNQEDLVLELHPGLVYQQMINEMEIRTGAKSTLERNVSEEEAMKNPEVRSILKKRTSRLRDICQSILDGIINSMNQLPYGIRLICKLIKELALQRFGEEVEGKSILKVTGYFVFYRFINLAIVTPDAYHVVDSDLSPMVRKNLVVVGKVLQNLFNFRTFGENAPEKYMRGLNEWITANVPLVEHYYSTLIQVDNPEDFLQVSKYNELTQRTKPVILISTHEIAATHALLLDNRDKLAPDEDDPLHQILSDLGDRPPEIDPEGPHCRDLQLTLANRFKVQVEDENPMERVYLETKELIIPVLRVVPVATSIHRIHLADVIESAQRFAEETENKELAGQVEVIRKNISELEEAGRISKSDHHADFVRDIALEVANRRSVVEQQRKEINRLEGTLSELKHHQTYVTEQIDSYKTYLQQCKDMHYAPAKGKRKKSSSAVGPFKFTYKELQRQNVIVESAVNSVVARKVTFLISQESPGTYSVVAKVMGKEVEKMELELDDLLERSYQGNSRLEVENPQIVLDIPMTIRLINQNFLS